MTVKIPLGNPICLTNGPGFGMLLNFHRAELASAAVTVQGFVLLQVQRKTESFLAHPTPPHSLCPHFLLIS